MVRKVRSDMTVQFRGRPDTSNSMMKELHKKSDNTSNKEMSRLLPEFMVVQTY